MARGRHARGFVRGVLPVLLVVLAVLGLTGGGVTYAAFRYDHSHSDEILPGVKIGGVDVGGMTRDQAVAAVRAEAETRLSSSVRISAADQSWTATSQQLGVHVDIDSAVDQALAVSDGYSMFGRLVRRIRQEPVNKDIALEWRYGAAKVRSFLAGISDGLASRARNASIELLDGELDFVHSRFGRELDADAATSKIVDALRSGKPSIRLSLAKTEPKISDETLGKTLVVDIATNNLFLYDGFEVERTYRVATAKPGFVTPKGVWTIVNKAENPTWYNPALDTWGKDLPPSIPPGPGNPLGTRALYLNAPDIRIHGTYDSGSIGTYASHGCIRMNISDSEALYPLVPIGTPVIIK